MRNIQGDPIFEERFEKIYSDYFPRMYLYARKLLKSDHLAEDVVAEVFYNLLKTKSDFSEVKEIETYLFVSVKNQVVRMLSKDPNVFVSLDIKNELKQIEQTNPEDLLLEKELAKMIDKELSMLSEQCQIIFRMARNEQMEYKDIALEMGISIDSVKSQVYKATNKIKECVAQWKNTDAKKASSFGGLAQIILIVVYSYFLSAISY